MQAGAHAALFGEEVGRHGRVVQEAEGVVGAGDEGVEESRGEVQGEGEAAEDGDVQGLAAREEVLHGRFEGCSFGVEAIGPDVFAGGVVLAADFKAFFEVFAAVESVGGDFFFGRALAYFFEAWLGVAPVCFGRGPCEAVLLGLRPREEVR